MKQWILYACILFASCSATMENEPMVHTNWPSRDELFDTFRNQDTAIIVYGKEDYAISDLLVNGIAALAPRDDRFKVITKRDDKLTEYEAANYPLYIIGTRNNLLVKRLSEAIPVRLIEGGFNFNGKDYMAPNDVVKLSFYPNVFNPKMPITVITGNHEDAIVQFVQQELNGEWGYFFWDSWGYQVYHNGRRTIIGNFSQDSTTLWSIDKKQHWEFDFEGSSVKTSGMVHYTAHNDPDVSNIDTWDAIAQDDLKRLSAFCGKHISARLEVHLYPTPEIKTMLLNDGDQSTIDFPAYAIHTVTTGEYANHRDEKLNMLALRNMMGEAGCQAYEEGLSVLYTTSWQNEEVQLLALKLRQADALPALDLLLNDQAFEGESDYLMHIAAASYVDFLINTQGREAFLAAYGKQPVINEALQTAWYASIDDLGKRIKMKQPEKAVLPQFLKGFNFAHEGYQIYNGYMGSEAEHSIAKLKDIGVNTITIIPYSGFQSMNKPFRFRYTTGAGMENDAAIVHASYIAYQQRMVTMLKPQLWSWLGWTGDIKMENAQDWDAFFEYYEEWIMHYALVAELYDFDIFCIGNEFQAASLSEHARWDELFEKVRKVYHGHITYAANWGAEFEQVTFWDKLDFISVNCYYPLSEKMNPTDAELLDRFEQNLNVIEKVQKKYNKEVIFTEIGFKSIAAPWIAPHKDADEQAYSEEAQQRCYETMFTAMQDEVWIKGLYIWKWPSYMDFSTEYTKDFNPCNKKAEKTISDWYKKL